MFVERVVDGLDVVGAGTDGGAVVGTAVGAGDGDAVVFGLGLLGGVLIVVYASTRKKIRVRFYSVMPLVLRSRHVVSLATIT